MEGPWDSFHGLVEFEPCTITGMHRHREALSVTLRCNNSCRTRSPAGMQEIKAVVEPEVTGS